MRQFDHLLRQGLMDANLAQYESVLRQTGEEPDFSPRYRRARLRLLSAPWEKRRAVPRLSRGLAALIAALLLATAAAAVSAPLWIAYFEIGRASCRERVSLCV